MVAQLSSRLQALEKLDTLLQTLDVSKDISRRVASRFQNVKQLLSSGLALWTLRNNRVAKGYSPFEDVLKEAFELYAESHGRGDGEDTLRALFQFRVSIRQAAISAL